MSPSSSSMDEPQRMPERVIPATTLSPGWGLGPALHLDPAVPAQREGRVDAADVARQVARFDAARARVGYELRAMRTVLRLRARESDAEIFDCHAAILEDEAFADGVRGRIEGQRSWAERAVLDEAETVARCLEETGTGPLRERALDVRDVARRLALHLGKGPEDDGLRPPEGSVVVARSLLPSQVLELALARTGGLVVEEVGPRSHVAILACGLRLPAVRVADAGASVRPAERVLVDGDRGELVLAPSRRRVRALAGWVGGPQRSSRARAPAGTPAPCVTADGCAITLRANLNRATEVTAARDAGLDGVGLLRTEALFLERATPPAEAFLAKAYGRVVCGCAGRPATIRTLDVKPDLAPAWLASPGCRDPAPATRGLRFSLREGRHLDLQLRAVARIAGRGRVRVLFPMVTGADELEAARERLERALASVDPSGARVPVGAMIETPAAVLGIDRILEAVDFVSIGTNDLTQFVLATERDLVGTADELSFLHPAVLRAVAWVVDRAHHAGCPVSVCGEAAGEPLCAGLLVGLGVRELSVSPGRAPRVRRALAGLDATRASGIGEQALRSRDVEQVKRAVRKLFA